MCKTVYTHHVPCNHTCFVGYLYCALFYSPNSPRRGLVCVNVHARGPLDTPPFAPFSLPLFPVEPNLSTSLLNSPISEILNNPIDEQLNLALPPEVLNAITPLPEELLTVQVDTLDAPCVTCEGTRVLYGGETRTEWEGRRERWLDVWEKGIEDGLWWGDGGYTFGQRINTDEHFATFVNRTFTEKQQRLADLAYQQRLQPSDNTDVDTTSIQDIFMESSDAAYLVNREMSEGSVDSGDSDTTETLPIFETASGSSADPNSTNPIKTLPLPLLPTPFDPVADPSHPSKPHPTATGTPPRLRTPFEAAVDSLPPLPPLHLPERRRRSITINPDTHAITFGGSPVQQQRVSDIANIAIRGNLFGTSAGASADLAASNLRTKNNNESGVEKRDHGRVNENSFVID